MERICRTLELLRGPYRFNGYIHAKAIPGCAPELVDKLGTLCDRMSVNIELPSENSLKLLAPNKKKEAILGPMASIRDGISQNKQELAVYRHAPTFVPAGQATQMIVGATPDSDFQIMRLSESLYKKYRLKRVFYSAYIPVSTSALLPGISRRLCCGNTGCIKPIGYCGITASGWRRFWTSSTPPWILCWIPNATGRCIIWISSQWR